jgi:enoyl-CoA hydratase/carnithine racemase
VADGLGIITMSKPPHNFLDTEFLSGVADQVRTLELRGARAAVLRSEVRSFCGGLDFQTVDGLGDATSRRRFFEAVKEISKTPVPIVAAIKGGAIGGGLGLALLCDVRIATPEAKLACNFVHYGLYPGFGTTYSLPELVGSSYAGWLMMSGRRIAGLEAKRVGLVDDIADPDQLDNAAVAIANEIASAGSRAVSELHRRRRSVFAAGISDAVEMEQNIKTDLLKSSDFAERLAASREPGFSRFGSK